MDLYSQIFTRASTTKFNASPLPDETLGQIESFISSVKPLIAEANLSHRILSRDDVKGMMLPKAPHFLMVSGKAHPLLGACAGTVI